MENKINSLTKPHSLRAIFVHHSTGANLIHEGNVRKLMKQLAPHIEFWDHGYDPEKFSGFNRLSLILNPYLCGLRNANGELLPESYHIPNHNTDPDGLAILFSQDIKNPPSNAISHLLEFDVIIFKSCYPVTAITNDQQLEKYIEYYYTIREFIDRHPTKLFISLTPPPLRANLTSPDKATRARQFADWMKSTEFIGQRGNLRVYDFFNDLAVPLGHSNENTLSPRFCRSIFLDSHPNKTANEIVAPLFVQFISNAIHEFSKAPVTERV